MTTPLNIFEYEACARDRLDRNAFDYYASGAHDELTLRENRSAYERIQLAYRVLVDVSRRNLGATVLNTKLELPVLISPTAFHGMACAEAELATARAAGQSGTVMILSSLSNTDVEDVVSAATGPVWFQLYVYRDRGATEALVRRAEAAGCSAIVLTVDAPLLGRREQDVRNRFHLPPHLSVKNMLASGYGEVSQESDESGLAAYFASLIDSSLNWDDIAWLRSLTQLPLIIKGIVRTDDALRAVQVGASGIMVSNHGGRQLDTCVSTISALPAIAQAVDGKLDVLVDGGVRRGTDVIKALALGAKAVGIGRPVLWGLAANGQDGVTDVLRMIRQEVDLAMALCGAPTVAAITPDLIAASPRTESGEPPAR